MADKKPVYITTTLPYVNAKPHIGFAMEIIRADVMARWKRAQGFEVFFNTGTDERGAKIFEAARKVGQKPQVYVNEAAKKFQALIPLLNLSEPNFIRTTDSHHIKAAR
ncbi:MAG: Methionine-tRNA ligase, partial [Candidatus Giovannonibacteria bacterium GW2011_GWA2_45_21]